MCVKIRRKDPSLSLGPQSVIFLYGSLSFGISVFGIPLFIYVAANRARRKSIMR